MGPPSVLDDVPRLRGADERPGTAGPQVDHLKPQSPLFEQPHARHLTARPAVLLDKEPWHSPEVWRQPAQEAGRAQVLEEPFMEESDPTPRVVKPKSPKRQRAAADVDETNEVGGQVAAVPQWAPVLAGKRHLKRLDVQRICDAFRQLRQGDEVQSNPRVTLLELASILQSNVQVVEPLFELLGGDPAVHGSSCDFRLLLVAMAGLTKAKVVDRMRFAVLLLDSAGTGFLSEDQLAVILYANSLLTAQKLVRRTAFDAHAKQLFFMAGASPAQLIAHEVFLDMVQRMPEVVLAEPAGAVSPSAKATAPLATSSGTAFVAGAASVAEARRSPAADTRPSSAGAIREASEPMRTGSAGQITGARRDSARGSARDRRPSAGTQPQPPVPPPAAAAWTEAEQQEQPSASSSVAMPIPPPGQASNLFEGEDGVAMYPGSPSSPAGWADHLPGGTQRVAAGSSSSSKSPKDQQKSLGGTDLRQARLRSAASAERPPVPPEADEAATNLWESSQGEFALPMGLSMSSLRSTSVYSEPPVPPSTSLPGEPSQPLLDVNGSLVPPVPPDERLRSAGSACESAQQSRSPEWGGRPPPPEDEPLLPVPDDLRLPPPPPKPEEFGDAPPPPRPPAPTDIPDFSEDEVEVPLLSQSRIARVPPVPRLDLSQISGNKPMVIPAPLSASTVGSPTSTSTSLYSSLPPPPSPPPADEDVLANAKDPKDEDMYESMRREEHEWEEREWSFNHYVIHEKRQTLLRCVRCAPLGTGHGRLLAAALCLLGSGSTLLALDQGGVFGIMEQDTKWVPMLFGILFVIAGAASLCYCSMLRHGFVRNQDDEGELVEDRIPGGLEPTVVGRPVMDFRGRLEWLQKAQAASELDEELGLGLEPEKLAALRRLRAQAQASTSIPVHESDSHRQASSRSSHVMVTGRPGGRVRFDLSSAPSRSPEPRPTRRAVAADGRNVKRPGPGPGTWQPPLLATGLVAPPNNAWNEQVSPKQAKKTGRHK